MKILFDHSSPFLLAHGGFQIQIEETKNALEKAGLEVEFLRWWDASQRGDIIHFFGAPPAGHAELAHRKGLKFVITNLLGGLGARPAWKRSLQKLIIGAALRGLPSAALGRAGWSTWTTADAYIAVTSWEARLMVEVFRAARERVHVVPNGVSDVFFQENPGTRTEWLMTTASIFPVKRLLETARAAVTAKTPYWVMGRPLSEADHYYREFSAFCRQHPDILRYDDVMRTHAELAQLYHQARGFVLLSKWETQSLSALEAAACQCPLLLSDLPWAHATFRDHVSYCPIGSEEQTARHLRNFYDEAPTLPHPPRPATWSEVAETLRGVYEHVLKS
jgi:glycosyltransferase involved in cell wall biosynthesis